MGFSDKKQSARNLMFELTNRDIDKTQKRKHQYNNDDNDDDDDDDEFDLSSLDEPNTDVSDSGDDNNNDMVPNARKQNTHQKKKPNNDDNKQNCGNDMTTTPVSAKKRSPSNSHPGDIHVSKGSEIGDIGIFTGKCIRYENNDIVEQFESTDDTLFEVRARRQSKGVCIQVKHRDTGELLYCYPLSKNGKVVWTRSRSISTESNNKNNTNRTSTKIQKTISCAKDTNKTPTTVDTPCDKPTQKEPVTTDISTHVATNTDTHPVQPRTGEPYVSTIDNNGRQLVFNIHCHCKNC